MSSKAEVVSQSVSGVSESTVEKVGIGLSLRLSISRPLAVHVSMAVSVSVSVSEVSSIRGVPVRIRSKHRDRPQHQQTSCRSIRDHHSIRVYPAYPRYPSPRYPAYPRWCPAYQDRIRIRSKDQP